jgi:precorrin-4 methylase
VPAEILELVRREAILQSSAVADHTTLGMVSKRHTEQGEQVVRLVGGDLAQNKGISREITELSLLNIPYDIISGISLAPVDIHTSAQTVSFAGVYAKHTKNININEMVGS